MIYQLICNKYHPSLIEYEDEACDVDVQNLYSFAKSVLDQRTELTFSSDRELLWQDLVKLGTSPGGKRPKALIAINRTTGEISSYEKAFDAMKRLELDYVDFEQMYRRMVFNVLAGNIDDHARNFSFIMDKAGRWSLAPAYDMIYSIDPSVLEVQKGQYLSVCGRKSGIMKDDLIYIGHSYDINRPGTIIERTLDVLSTLHDYMREESIDESVWKMVSKELDSKYSNFSM